MVALGMCLALLCARRRTFSTCFAACCSFLPTLPAIYLAADRRSLSSCISATPAPPAGGRILVGGTGRWSGGGRWAVRVCIFALPADSAALALRASPSFWLFFWRRQAAHAGAPAAWHGRNSIFHLPQDVWHRAAFCSGQPASMLCAHLHGARCLYLRTRYRARALLAARCALLPCLLAGAGVSPACCVGDLA